MNELRIIAITHREFPLETIGQFHIDPSNRNEVLGRVKTLTGIQEIMLLSTCNRVELIFTLPHYVCPGLTAQILSAFQPNLDANFIKGIALKAARFNGPEALEHLLRVSSSLESLVIGEREIITQMRKSYEECEALGHTGDDLRLVMKQCIKTAKEVFTHTDLAKKPVSVVSLAWKRFREYGVNTDSRILLIGAGQIIRNFSKFLLENGYGNITVSNRSIVNAEKIAAPFKGTSLSLEDLKIFKGGFDVLVSCTASENAIINSNLYAQINCGELNHKLVIDLALPADIDSSVINEFPITYVGMKEIQQLASSNMEFREKALHDCEPIIENGVKEYTRLYNERQVERAMRSIPEAIREIKQTALGSVFLKDLEQLDANSREVLEKILGYMEKKYISVPMKMAREVLLDAVSKN